jgi:hypothetical protein
MDPTMEVRSVLFRMAEVFAPRNAFCLSACEYKFIRLNWWIWNHELELVNVEVLTYVPYNQSFCKYNLICNTIHWSCSNLSWDNVGHSSHPLEALPHLRPSLHHCKHRQWSGPCQQEHQGCANGNDWPKLRCTFFQFTTPLGQTRCITSKISQIKSNHPT